MWKCRPFRRSFRSATLFSHTLMFWPPLCYPPVYHPNLYASIVSAGCLCTSTSCAGHLSAVPDRLGSPFWPRGDQNRNSTYPEGDRRLVNVPVRRRGGDPGLRSFILHSSTHTAGRLAINASRPRPPPTDRPYGPTTPLLAYSKREAPGVQPGQRAREVTNTSVRRHVHRYTIIISYMSIYFSLF